MEKILSSYRRSTDSVAGYIKFMAITINEDEHKEVRKELMEYGEVVYDFIESDMISGRFNAVGGIDDQDILEIGNKMEENGWKWG